MEKSKSFSLNTVEDFSILEVSTKKSNGEKKTHYELNRTEAKKTGTKKTLSVVDDYAQFDFRAGRSRKSDIEKTENATVSVKKSCKRKPKSESKVQEPVLVVEKNSEGSIKLEKSELERHIMKVAEASERFETDDAASRVVLVARMGSLFGCVK